MGVDRRSVLRSVPIAALGVAGCLSMGAVTDLTVSNRTTNGLTTTLRVTPLPEGETVVDDTVALDPDASMEYEDVSSGSRVRVHVSVRDGSEATHDWIDGESGASGLAVAITTDSIEFTEGIA